MIKAVIFDMDGVLIDSEPVYLKWMKQFLDYKGISVPQEELLLLVGSSGKTLKETMEKWWKKYKNEDVSGEILVKESDMFDEQFKLHYMDIRNPGAKEIFEILKKRYIKIAVASSSSLSNIKQVLKETELSGYVDVIVSGEMFEESKPSPEIYHYTVSQLGFLKEECIAVEDSLYGILSAKNAGLKVIAKEENRFGFDQSLADYCIDNLTEVQNIISEL